MQNPKNSESPSFHRRSFLRWGVKSTVASALVASCRTGAAKTIDAAPSGNPTPGEIASRPASPEVIAGICQQTASNIEGPFFKADAPFRANLIPSDAPLASHFRLRGQVMGADCAPLAGAIMELWQADLRGEYDLQGQGMRARLRTDENGRYQVDTIEPGRYLNGRQYRPAHLHVKVHAVRHHSLTTQLYFVDDPFNGVDPWFVPELLIRQAPSEGPSRSGQFDFYLGAAAK